MEDGLLIKASGIIHITHKLSLMQHQLWNLLLVYAYPDLNKKIKHKIPLSLIKSYLGYTRNDNHIKNALYGLGTVVHSDVFGMKLKTTMQLMQELQGECQLV